MEEPGGGLRIQLRRSDVRRDGPIEILGLLVRAAEIDIRGRPLAVGDGIGNRRILLNRRREVAAQRCPDRVHIHRLGLGQIRAIREQRHPLQQLLPGSIGELDFRIGFGPSNVRQGERRVDLERALQRLACLKIGTIADRAGTAVVPHHGLRRRHVPASSKQTRSEPHRQQRRSHSRGDQHLRSDQPACDARRRQRRGRRAGPHVRSCDVLPEFHEIGAKRFSRLIARGRLFRHRAGNDPVEARRNRRIELRRRRRSLSDHA